ncbi:MAG: hypothetical protein DMG41_29965 [Acidobacteria bacterium]|nr:MAG: hypothetical protein AUH13_04230 [Acidobacteria bacterium 13_2_20CM_58_27]PYT63367.1 MAG: hypothetical protein DMG42_36385 [Acidobacteriota bacterium]PYT83772.1 MAG: hypothetical protein DMG41_29965 [Acidobacteriota bacterium]
MADRTNLLINCSTEEAHEIRKRARLQRRTISGYALTVVMRIVEYDEMFLGWLEWLPRMDPNFSERPLGPRTTLLLCCSSEESQRIRRIAGKRDTTISGFVLYTLRRAWKIADELSSPPQLGH